MGDAVDTLRNVQESYDWLHDHLESLKDQYGGEYVAVKGEKVVAHDPSHDEVVQAVEAEGIDPSKVLIKYIQEQGEHLIR
jgi:hypothetical protein